MKSEVRRFERGVREITQTNAAKGKLKSGGTLIEVKELLDEILDERMKQYFAELEGATFEWSDGLEIGLETFLEYFQDDLAHFESQLQALFELVGNERAADKVKSELQENVQNRIEKIAVENLRRIHSARKESEVRGVQLVSVRSPPVTWRCQAQS